MNDSLKIIGVIEQVAFPDFDGLIVNAKIDTGAFTGALHTTNIEVKKVDGVDTLFFSPFDHPEIIHSTSDFSQGIVKSSSGHSSRRYFIKTKVNVRGEIYKITLSLADRSEMKIPIIIGRRFLSAYNFLVDVKQTSDVNLKQGDD